MLAAERGDPEVVGWDWSAAALEFENDLGIVMRGRLVDAQHEAIVTKQSWSRPASSFRRRRGGGVADSRFLTGPSAQFGMTRCVPFWEEFVFWRGKFVDFEDLMD